MRRLLISLSILLLALAAPRHAFSQSDTSDLFLNAYMANQQGEQFESSGDTQKALSKYRYAASLLDQISHDDPKWQPLVVDYRKKRVSQNISRLQQQAGPGPGASTDNAAPPPSAPASTPMDGALPGKGGDIMPTPDLNNGQPTQPPSNTGNNNSSLPQQVRDQFNELQSTLHDAQLQLHSVEREKQDLADRLDAALKQIDAAKINVNELRGQLKQAQDAFQNSIADHAQAQPSSGSQKQMQQRIDELTKALQNAEAERDAADEQTAEYVRRNAKAHQATTDANKQLADANTQNKEITAKYSDAAKLVGQLDAAKKQIAALTKAKNDATSRADDLDSKLADASKDAAKLAAAQKEIAALKSGDQTTASKNSEVAAKLADARKQITQLTSDRDSARAAVATLTTKLSDAQKQITTVKTDRDSIAAQRDQALADLKKARDAQKHVDQLLTDNATLTAKLAADDKLIKDFKSGSPEKDKEIADLRKEVSDTKALLASAQQERDNVQSTLNDLQQQYDSTSTQLAELKASSSITSADKKNLTTENDLLRGIVLRQLKEQARRDQTKRLITSELRDLKVQSDTLDKRLDYLGQPVVQLTEQEKALFKDPSIDLADSDNNASAMDITIAAPKQDSAPSSTNPTAAATPAAIDSGTAASLPSAADLANRTNPSAPETTSTSAAPVTSGTSAATTGTGSPAVTAGGPNPQVPQELMGDARAAKEAFERTEYRDAERIYEKMLTKAPNNVYILSNLGVVYFRNQKWNLAEESLKKAIAVAPDDTFSHCTLGIVYYQEKRYDDAINSLTRALALNPKYSVAHNYLGITASQKGWQDAAVNELKTAIDIDPNYGDACFNLAVVYAMQHPPNKELARKFYTRATALGAEPDSGLEQLIK